MKNLLISTLNPLVYFIITEAKKTSYVVYE